MSKFKTRWLELQDYTELCKWWKAFRFPAPTQQMLPDGGLSGVMVSKNGVNICAGFLYKTNSQFAYCEYVVSNFEYKEKDRKEALQELYNTIEMLAKADGYAFIFSSVKNESLISKMQEFGWIKGSETTEMVKLLNQEIE